MKYAVIQVDGGVAEITHKPDDVKVVIFDWDSLDEILTGKESEHLAQTLDDGDVRGAVAILEFIQWSRS